MALTVGTNTLAVTQANNNKLEEVLDKTLLEMIKIERDQFIFSKLGVDKMIPKKAGTKTITVRRANSLPVNLTVDGQGKVLEEGLPPVPLQVSYIKVSGAIDQRGAYIKETDVNADISYDDIRTDYMPELARHSAEVTERATVSKIKAEGNVMFLGGATSIDTYTSSTVVADAVLTFQALRKAALAMKLAHRKGHSKFGGKYVTVLHPSVMQDLLDDSDLIDKFLDPGNDNSPMKTGTLAQYKIFDMYVTESQILEPVASAGEGNPNVYSSYMLGKDPYMTIGLGAKNGKAKFIMSGFTADSSNPLAQTQTFGYKMWGGAKVIDPVAITEIYSLSNYDVADFTGYTAATDKAIEKAPYTDPDA